MVSFGIHPKIFIFLGGILPMILRGSLFAEKHLNLSVSQNHPHSLFCFQNEVFSIGDNRTKTYQKMLSSISHKEARRNIGWNYYHAIKKHTQIEKAVSLRQMHI